MGLATTTTVASVCNFTLVSTAIVTPHLPAAERIVRGRIGDTIYAAIEAAAGAPYDAAAKTAAQRAESLICGAIVLRTVLHQANDGGVVTAQSSVDGLLSQSASPAQLARMASALEVEAYQALERWELRYRAAEPEAQAPRTVRLGRMTIFAASPRRHGNA